MTANLTISALAAIGTAGVVPVSVELTDGTGTPVIGFTGTGPVVLPSSTVTNSSGEVTLALEPNANITPTGTYYVVKVADRRFLIEKSASTQTLQAAVAEIIEDLGMATALLRTNNLSDLTNAATARTNLGLGNSATLDVGTTAGTVTAGDDPRLSAAAGPAGGVLAGTYPNPSFAADMATQAELDAHTGDPTDAHAASAITNTPAGSIAATTVQAAINELDTEKVAKAGDTFTGTLAGTHAATTTDSFTAQVSGDTNTRIVVNAGGTIEWGPGNAAVDTNLYRSAADTLKTDDKFRPAHSVTDPANQTFHSLDVTQTLTTGNSNSLASLTVNHLLASGSSNQTGAVRGAYFLSGSSSTYSGTMTLSDCFVAQNSIATSSTITTTRGVSILAPSGSGTATNTVGMNVANMGRAGTTSTYGINIAAQTGSTSNYGLAVGASGTYTLWLSSVSDSTTAAGGITFGSSGDTNLYRSAANTLKTDDKLITAIGLGVGNSAAATTLGTVVKKMEVFDASGTSLGFIPIYNAIT